ncbi:glycerophosphodiester phosphodiesterase family protein [Aureimonas sp. AU22]|uniref:glycerophosphodiester phosphodiesterase family protein n=1 Tax=Aureimonas sp. AU22 TaxID=1638162 RepID=UPI000706CD46|nr:glycerophosphodiester phosphodiesterase family protein [Aureimonas sp. AU22]BAT29988.1 glycerophosphoryl diester phosphodiesterase [Aureimonas sp. AU22]
MAGASSDLGWLTAQPIAHRGLHDRARGIPENSMAAFRAAIENGYAIECDIHRTSDGVPVVFHDHDLLRLTGEAGTIDTLTAADVRDLRILGTPEAPPTLAALLELVNGQVPIVVEAKGIDASADAGFMTDVAGVLDAYRGPLALMSFDEWLLDQTGDLDLPVGLTAEGTRPDVLERHRVVFERRCAFVSYNVHHLPNAFVAWVREVRRAPVISWTVRTPADVEHSRAYADQMTFEAFIP